MKKSLWLGCVILSMMSIVVFGVLVTPEGDAVEETIVVTEITLPTKTPYSPPQGMYEYPSPTSIPTDMPTLVPTEIPPTPTATPPPIVGYFIRLIDMDGYMPVAMVITKADGSQIISTWANAIGYHEGDDESVVFSPYEGTVYSHQDSGFLATWVHSGRLKRGDLFAWELEKAVYMNEWGGILNLAEGYEAVNQLIGATVRFCQANQPESLPAPLSVFDPSQPCQGDEVEFIISAAALIERERVEEYDAAVGRTVSWLIENEQGNGFEQLVPGYGYLLQTCVGKFKDQVSDGTKDYLYNRLILGLTLRE